MELKLHASGNDARGDAASAADTKKLRYTKSGILAVNERAYSWFYEPPLRENREVSGVAIVDIKGPLAHHDGDWCDSYDSIQQRVVAACATNAVAVVLRIDSPGGDAAGCFEAAQAIRETCVAEGKPLIAYVDGHALSAGYALACAASRVVLAKTALVGSVGIINRRLDVSAAMANDGVRVAFIASGDRKADGSPELAITDAEIADTRLVVDSLASVFFDHVAESRGALTTQAIAAMNGRVFHGASAIQSGLADEIKSFDALIAELSGATSATAEPPAQGADMTKMQEARAALRIAAKGKGAEAAAARFALKALAADGTEEPAAAATDAPATDAPATEPAAAEAPAAMPEGFTAFLEQVAATAGVDSDTALKTMMGMADQIGGLVRDALDSGGGKVATETKTEETTAEAKRLAEIEARAKQNGTEILVEKFGALSAEVADLKARETARIEASAKQAEDDRAKRVDGMIAAGSIRLDERDDALFLYAASAERFERVYVTGRQGANRATPVGMQQAGSEPGRGGAPAAAGTTAPTARAAAEIDAAVQALNASDRSAYSILTRNGYTPEKALTRISQLSASKVA